MTRVPPSRPLVAALLLSITTGVAPAAAQSATPFDRAVAGLALRGIGPALMGGRIADIAVHPSDSRSWFVAVGSGGLWKTTNAGVTWTPFFDDQASYSIGVVTLDPTNPNVVWVGTGENVSGRHVGWGDGVYVSRDAGGSWTRAGLPRSEHIGRILVDPRDGDVVLVAAEGPLWSSGGERGVYKTTDGGATWTAVLSIDDDTGVTDLEFAPDDPDVVYAAAYQRRRTVASFLAGGPQSGIYRSDDGGDSWSRVSAGLPSGDLGKIGLAVTAADPDRVYATIEADASERGFYRSDDRGQSWRRMNPYISGGTGPHYYQEIEASQVDPDRVYQMDVFIQVTRDGGHSFDNLETGRAKHSDNHALWIDPDDPRHMLAGTDGGLYETFDEGFTFRHFPNLPISQFYKVALSQSEPFYEILGGAQDLGTLLGPARTTNGDGVRNRDWTVPMGADGYGVQIDPTDANTLYLMTQQGNISRYDRRSEEAISIQPQPEPGDAPERWNWDSPILISPHDSDRLYFASQRLWRSDDRGDSWTPVSGDLTTNTNRYTLPIMGRVQSIDALYDNGAMSRYATSTAISESPLAEGTLYVGTDDGLIHATTDGGATWTPAAALPGVPDGSFINDLEASQHDAATVFAAADAHKTGDFTPYLFMSTDHGATWRSIAGDLPEGTLVWAVEQDHETPQLLFAGTEFGLYVSPDLGRHWVRLPGAPTIAFRDLELHRRDDDVVGATFGRGFYVLDDYGPLREMATGALDGGTTLLGVRDAWWYLPNAPMQALGQPSQGSDSFTAPNPDFGATFTYFVDDVPSTAAAVRRASEREQAARGADVPFPGWETLRAEAAESGPRTFLQVRDAQGTPVRRIEGPTGNGLHRVTWDLRRPPPDPVDLSTPGFTPPWVTPAEGPLAPPGRYSVELVRVSSAGVSQLGEARSFEVRPVPTAPAGTDFVVVAEFQARAGELRRRIAGAGQEIGRVRERLRHMRAALVETPAADVALYTRMDTLDVQLDQITFVLNGDPIPGRRNEATAPGLSGRVGQVIGGHWGSRQMPTATQRRNLEIAEAGVDDLIAILGRWIETDLAGLEADLAAAGAPWTPGRKLSGGGGPNP